MFQYTCVLLLLCRDRSAHLGCPYVQVSLLEQPQISYSLIVQGGDISFLPGLEVFINNVLREQVWRLNPTHKPLCSRVQGLSHQTF